MRQLFGLVIAGGMLLALATGARAQVGISIGNPYTGQGVTIGTGGAYANPGYGYGYPGYGTGARGYGMPYGTGTYYGSTTAYAPGFGRVTTYSAPTTTYYSSGYSGYYPGFYGSTLGTPYYGYGAYSSYGYGYPWNGYGYGGYGMRGYRARRGIRIF